MSATVVYTTRLAVRKNRGGQQGREYPIRARVIEHPEKDEDGEAITTMVVDWVAVPPAELSRRPILGLKAASRSSERQRCD